MKSELRMSDVVAIRLPMFSCEPRPKMMPFGLIRNTRPFELKDPKIADGSLPVTRLSVTELELGC